MFMFWYDGAMDTGKVCNFIITFGYSTWHCLYFAGTMESGYIALFSLFLCCGCIYCPNLLQTLLSFCNCYWDPEQEKPHSRGYRAGQSLNGQGNAAAAESRIFQKADLDVWTLQDGRWQGCGCTGPSRPSGTGRKISHWIQPEEQGQRRWEKPRLRPLKE